MIYIYLLLCVQIVLESLPVSSSGHLILLQTLLKKQDFFIFSEELATVTQQEMWQYIMHIMHGPTACILIIFFFSTWFSLLVNARRSWFIILKLICYTIVADGVTVLFYIFFSRIRILSFPLPLGFLITAVLLLVQRYFMTSISTRLTVRKSLFLGCAQGFALLPGISRFAAVFVAARWCGFCPKKAFNITWMLLFPLILGSCMVSVYVLSSVDALSYIITPETLIISCGATIFGYAALWFVYVLACKDRLWWFGIYMLLVTIASCFVV